MRIGSYLFSCQFTAPAVLPGFKGSMLRGAFGHGLKSVVCAQHRAACGDCLLREACGYAFIFEVSKSTPEHGPGPVRIAARPHPFVLEPPDSPQRFFSADAAFTFGFRLFGRAHDFLPHIIYAVERMGETGIGKGIEEGAGRFRLNSVHSAGRLLYDGAAKVLTPVGPQPELTLADPAAGPCSALAVRLLTPLRLKHDNHLQDSLPFHVLIRAALRRISTLGQAYGGGEPALDYSGLSRRATQVVIARNDCQWIDLRRYSNRQKSGMLIGGLQGAIHYSGDLAEFLPLLSFCEQTNIGKQTAFGLGRMAVEATNE